MSTMYTDVDAEESGTDYDNAGGNPALYELAVSENPNYSSLSSKRNAEEYPPPTGFVDIQYDQASSTLKKNQELYDDRTLDEPQYLQTSGIDDNDVARRVLLQADQPTYHYVEPEAFGMKPDMPPQPWWKRPQFLGSIILLVALAIGASALVMVSKGDDAEKTPNTGASSADVSLPSGMVVPFLTNECPEGWSRLDGRRVDTATFIPAYAFQIPAGGLKMPDVESDRLFIRPASTEYEPGTIEEDTTSGKGLSVKSVSVWGTTHKRITYVSDENASGLLFVDEATAPVQSSASETRPKSISLLYCAKI